MFSTLCTRVLIPSLLSLTLAHSVSAQNLDSGVDPANLGKGDWIYFLSAATNKLGGYVESVTNVTSLFEFYKKQGMDFIAVKAGTGHEEFPANSPQFTAELVQEAHAAGLKIFGYTRSFGTNVPGEIQLAHKVNELGADGFIIDAEAEWEESRLGEDGPALAIELCEGIKKAYPNKFLAHAPLPIISLHRSFPYKEFGLYCDSVMPQAYWKSIGVSPTEMVEWMDEEWHAWHKSLTGSDTNAIKPLAPIGQGWSPSESEVTTPMEIMEFIAALNHDKNPPTPDRYKGVSYWRTDLHTMKMWKSIRKADIGKPKTTPLEEIELAARTGKQQEIKEKVALRAKLAAQALLNENGLPIIEDANNFIVDDSNPNVTFIGKWQMGKNLHEKRVGTNYWYAVSVMGDATATAVYRPLIRNTGEYDIYVWHIAHKNRSQQVPWLISHDEGKELVNIDQTTKGARWVLLAKGKRFKSGTDGFISVSNDTGEGGRVVIADALKFVRSGGENPGAEEEAEKVNSKAKARVNPTSALAIRE